MRPNETLIACADVVYIAIYIFSSVGIFTKPSFVHLTPSSEIFENFL